jgi:hypothetical protein
MEVHHHAHTPRKKWIHYLWEFLMLFLAVTLGFLVENQREHYIEHQRAKEYAQLMVEDLKKDTVLFGDWITAIEAHVKSFDTVSILFGQSPPVSNARLIKAVLTQRTTYRIPLFPTTFNQMKSSGTLRYLRNMEISRRASQYYDRWHTGIKTSFDYNDDFFSSEVQRFMLDHFDYSESSYFGDSLLVDNPKYLDRSLKTDILLRNRLLLYVSLLKYTVDDLIKPANEMASTLIGLLKKEYHLK